MKKIIKLTESQLKNVVEKILNEEISSIPTNVRKDLSTLINKKIVLQSYNDRFPKNLGTFIITKIDFPNNDEVVMYLSNGSTLSYSIKNRKAGPLSSLYMMNKGGNGYHVSNNLLLKYLNNAYSSLEFGQKK